MYIIWPGCACKGVLFVLAHKIDGRKCYNYEPVNHLNTSTWPISGGHHFGRPVPNFSGTYIKYYEYVRSSLPQQWQRLLQVFFVYVFVCHFAAQVHYHFCRGMSNICQGNFRGDIISFVTPPPLPPNKRARR